MEWILLLLVAGGDSNSDLGVMNQWPPLPRFIHKTHNQQRMSGLHPVESFIFRMIHMCFMKSGKSLAKN